MTRTRYQNADERELHRSQIRGAEYNPRKIAPIAERRLQAHVKKHGLQGTIIVNERTAANGWAGSELGYFVVSGHQRLNALDHLEKTPDFTVPCSVMHLTPAEEREQNLYFNSPGAQGDFDIALLGEVVSFEGVDHEAAGFDALTLIDYGIFDGDMVDETAAAPEAREMAHDAAAIAQAARDRKAAYRAQERAKDDESPGQYVLLYYTTESERDAFLTAVGNVADPRYVSMTAVLAAMGLEVNGEESGSEP